MAKNWRDGYYENPDIRGMSESSANAAGFTKFNSTTSQLTVDGTAVPPFASMTFAEMGNLTAPQLALLAGMPVHINDVHNNSDGIGGSYIVRDSSPAGWAQISGPMYYATFAVAPNPATYPGWRIRVGNCGLGGADMIARGGYWRYVNGRQLVGATTNITVSSNKDVEASLIKVTIPINNSKSLLQAGDSIDIDLHFGKSGTADRISRSVRLGTNASTITSNTSLDGVITSSASNLGLDEFLPFAVISNVSIKRSTPVGFSLYNGITGTARISAVTVSNLDNALQYLDLAMYLTDGAADGIADTLTCEAARIYINHGF